MIYILETVPYQYYLPYTFTYLHLLRLFLFRRKPLRSQLIVHCYLIHPCFCYRYLRYNVPKCTYLPTYQRSFPTSALPVISDIHIGKHYSCTEPEADTKFTIVQVALITIGLWFFAWTPYLVINYGGIFESITLTPIATVWGSVFAKANAVYNPIVYGAR